MVADTVEMLPAISPVREAAKPRPAPTTASWADVRVELGACHGGDTLRRLAAAEGWGQRVAEVHVALPGAAPMQLFELCAVLGISFTVHRADQHTSEPEAEPELEAVPELAPMQTWLLASNSKMRASMMKKM